MAGLILLTGTDLSIGRMVGMGMTANHHHAPGHQYWSGLWHHVVLVFQFYQNHHGFSLPVLFLCTCFTSIAGFFTASLVRPFISTIANMLIIFGIVTYATKRCFFGAIEPSIPDMVIPTVLNSHQLFCRQSQLSAIV